MSMANFFHENLDYISFCYGLAFILLGAVCVSLQKAERERLPWGMLGLSGLILGITEWAELTALQLGDTVFFLAVRSLLLLLSLLFLMEFARAGGNRLRGKGPGRWILLLPLAMAAAGGAAAGWRGLDVAARYALGLPAGLWTAGTLYRYAERQAGLARRLLMAVSILTGICAVTGITAVPPASFFPASLVNRDIFFLATGLPVQFIRTAMAFGIAFLIYAYSEFPLLKSPERQLVHRSYRNLHRAFVLVILIILAGGWVVTSLLGRLAFQEATDEGTSHMTVLKSHLALVLNEPERAVQTLALSSGIVTALVTGKPKDLNLANIVLDQYRDITGAAVCYLLDSRGTAIASSNRFMPGSFVGHSYAFRHYYQSAAGGAPAVQFALGVTSGERGYYVSCPVFAPDGRTIGVAVIKQSLDQTEAIFPKQDYVFLVSPEGVIFLSNHPELRFNGLWPLTARNRQKLLADRQLGSGPFPALLSREPQDGEKITFHGLSFLVMRQALNREGWLLVHFEPMEIIKIYRFRGTVLTFTLCLLTIGLSIFLKNSLESTALVGISESRFRAIFESAPGAIFIVDEESSRIIQSNPFLKDWLGYGEDELNGMTLGDFRTADAGGQENLYRKKDGSVVDVEETRTRVPFHGKEALLIVAHDISEHKRIKTVLRDLSQRDGLTGLANRRYLDESLDREWKQALREKSPLSILMCDIDYFKNFNDTYGHQQGDNCLRAVARVLEQGLHRPLDVAARYGGEEFVLVIPDTPLAGALVVAESVRRALEALAIPHIASAAAPVVTISIGVASVVPSPDGSAAQIVSAADQALYRAKGAGRNRVAT
jgi:diguanylate cyclase (GGDEF)-like protein